MIAALVAAGLQLQAQSPPKPTPTANDEITVTANRSSTPLGETAKTVYTLTPEDLHDYPALTLDESLRQHPGFELFRRASSRIANPTSEGISLRGLGSTAASRTLVLLDGAPLNDPFGGYIHWTEIPQPAIDSITLVTGGGSDLYGSSALGGVIDVLPTAEPAPVFQFTGIGGSQATSDLTGLVSRTVLPGREQGIGMLAAGESLRTGGYIPTSPSLAGAVDVPSNVLSQSYRTELGRRSFSNRRLFVTGNLLNESRSNGTPLQTNATRLWRYLAAYDSPSTNAVTGRARVFGSAEGYRQAFSAINAARSSENLTRLQSVHTQELGATGDTTLRVRPFTVVLGGDARDLRATDNETPISGGKASGLQGTTARQRFVGGFGEILSSHGGWSGAASLRADRASNLDIVQTTASTRTAPPDRTEIVLSPRLGLLRSLGPHVSAHASVFRAFRTPTFNELYRTGQVGQETTLANAALLSERATGYEAGAQLTLRGTMVQGTWFWTEINRPVSAVLVSQTATTITNQRENLGQIRSRGLELFATRSFSRSVSTTLGYQLADSTVTRFAAQPAYIGNQIPQVPRHSVTAQVRAAIPRIADLTLAARASSHAYDDAANNFPLAPFFQLDLSGTRTISRQLALTFQVQNLTNQRQEVARTPILTLGSPILAEAGVRLRLGKP